MIEIRNTLFLLSAMALTLALAWPLQGLAQRADDAPLDHIVALVEDDVIMHSELQNRLDTVRQQILSRGGRLPPDDVLIPQVLERLIIERLQLQQATRAGIRIDDITLNQTMERIARENSMSLPEFRDRLVADGIDFQVFREQIRDEMTIGQLRRRQVENRIQVSEQEIDDLIASESGAIDRDVEYRLSHILVPLPEGANAADIQAARERAEAIRKRAVAGENFSELALSESAGQQALEGGDLGWRAAAQVPTLFARNVVLMREGEVSELIRSPSGFHLIKLQERRGGERAQITQTHARHILIQPTAILSQEDARERIAGLRNRILMGNDFADLARAHSDDRGSAMRGGDLGWTDPGDLVPQFEEVMNALAPNTLSEPFLSPFGWHIVEVLDRRTYDSSRQLMRAQAREIIRERKREEETELWLRRLRDEAYVELRLQTRVSGL
ncbi:SurA domain protein [Thioalkalivibrio sulfidiphilus HL-EbGr7]|uniref:Chaperone SurA n=1 Tax=Thioalkalivibrio sulfidiphilus (strain HL-EbGR7) TaxID=396588 RepID=B8GMX5_THISH|nr:peptidylprolyl isomerase [Thioalkalivibrio sulfidiphilus]ACL73790.1 SurA domain protein [Thioalkalivibrio sulfidiphilus HL-EbGr7]